MASVNSDPSAKTAASRSYLALLLPLLPLAPSKEQPAAATPAPEPLVLEACSFLLASCRWDMAHAADEVAKAEGNLDTQRAVQVSQSLRSAAGGLALLRTSLVPLLRPASRTADRADLDPELLYALETTALAQAQSLSLLRAVAKQHSPGVVAGIARDTAEMFAAAFWKLQNHVYGR
jgi:hypothetical protein